MTDNTYHPDGQPPWPTGTDLRFGDRVTSRFTGRHAIIVHVYQEDGVQRVNAVYDDDDTVTIIGRLNPAAFSRMTRPQPYLSEMEWAKRSARWANGELSDERALGRLEGQLMSTEMYLVRATGMGLSLGRIIEMLGSDASNLEMLVTYQQEKINESKEA